MSDTVVIFGAGATRACGGPLTNEILPHAFDPATRGAIEREGYTDLLHGFLTRLFHLPPAPTPDDYPSLPLLISLLDTAIDRRQPMGPTWPVNLLREVRRALQYVIFALLELELRSISHNYYEDLFTRLDPAGDNPPNVISLNYDIIADNALARHYNALAAYGCDIATGPYRAATHGAPLLKIHGSLNWSYCPGCHRLDLGVAESRPGTVKLLEELYQVNPLEPRYSCHGFPCSDCGADVEPLLITPTQHKDYRNPHIARVWFLAEEALRKANRAIFIGYSLPDDDLDVIYLLQRGLGHLAHSSPHDILVAEKTPRDSDVGRRYRTLFGPSITWCDTGFAGLLPML
ncbi:MAG: SIR2 family protein [Bryobacteraceae bacterium]